MTCNFLLRYLLRAGLVAALLRVRPTAAIQVQQSRRSNQTSGSPLVFYGIDSYLDDTGRALRSASRRTWLPAVLGAGDEYRFFGFDLDDVLEANERSDFVVVPSESYDTSHQVRMFQIVAFAFRWGLAHTTATYIVKPDHDDFICAGHLHHDLANGMVPDKKLFLGTFYPSIGQQCRADQDFLLYSRDVLEMALEKYLQEPLEMKPGQGGNWAFSWSVVMRHLWSRGEITVLHEPRRFDTQLDSWHMRDGRIQLPSIVPMASSIPAEYCKYKLGIHVISKDVAVFDAIMANGGPSAEEYAPSPVLGLPRCLNDTGRCRTSDWRAC